MITNLKRVAVLLCVIFITPVILWSCSKGKHICEDLNKPSTKTGENIHDANLTNQNKARRLRLNEIRLSTQLTKKQVLSKWGSPDSIEGFGVEYLVYKLDDGRMLWLLFASQETQPLLKAMIFTNSRDTKGKTIFDGMNETKLR
jgi:hypothetical protein